jgi:beta-barrel assembly-enhancing protease
MSKFKYVSKRGIAMVAVAALMLPGITASAQDAPARSGRMTDAERVIALRDQDARLVTIAERLAIAGRHWCEAGHSLGWILNDLGQFPKTVRAHVRTTHSLSTSTGLFVSAVAPGGSAAQAGITPGTTIFAINGEAPMRHSGDAPSAQAVRATERTIGTSLTENNGVVSVGIVDRSGTRRTVELRARAACPGQFRLLADDMEQAYADGKDVMVTLGMARFAATDDELAGVVAHEIAHNLLNHMDRQNVHDIPDDYTRHLTVNARVLRGMEEESDRLSVWLLAAAGYNVEAPIGFWQRFGPDNNTAHPMGRLHDPWEMRVASLRDELVIMRRERARDRNARPAILAVAAAEMAEWRRRRAEREGGAPSSEEPAADASAPPAN